MRLTVRTDIAMRTLMFCAVNSGRTVRKHEIADSCGASENHLAQVINLLGRAGFLKTQRGRTGGMTLGRAPDAITVGEVFRTFEGVLPFTDCADKAANCPLSGACRLKCILSEAVEDFFAGLDRVSLADLVAGNSDLASRLAVG